MGEWQIEAALEARFRSLGADGPAFGTIVGSGERGCILHYSENTGSLEAGDLVLLDGGAAVGLYSADLTRTFPVSGRFTGAQRAAYQIVESARTAAVRAIRPGVTVEAVQASAVQAIVEGLVAEGILQGDPDELREREDCKPFFPHRVSHWLGLDVHDPGSYEDDGGARILEPGMVLTVEPGLYFRPGSSEAARSFEGLAVRVEDDVLVTSEGHEVLSADVPTNADDLCRLVGSAEG
jgi:Xaa-Pro aminopeptidase